MTTILQLEQTIAAALNRTVMWDELRDCFIEASETGNGELCRSIVKYYRWSVDPARCRLPNDVQTSAVMTFLEKMVRSRERIQALLKWLTKEEILAYAWHVADSGGDDAVEFIRKCE